MAQNAAQRNQEFMDSFEGGEGGAAADGIAHEEALTSGKRDDSRRAYYREFKKVVEAADVILQVLDVRDPLGCRSKQIEEMILNAGANKRIILILNKIGKELERMYIQHLNPCCSFPFLTNILNIFFFSYYSVSLRSCAQRSCRAMAHLSAQRVPHHSIQGLHSISTPKSIPSESIHKECHW